MKLLPYYWSKMFLNTGQDFLSYVMNGISSHWAQTQLKVPRIVFFNDLWSHGSCLVLVKCWLNLNHSYYISSYLIYPMFIIYLDLCGSWVCLPEYSFLSSTSSVSLISMFSIAGIQHTRIHLLKNLSSA